jgi:hypothetical protein
MWLKNLIGFDESKEAIYKNIIIKDSVLTSKVNNKSYHYGTLETPTLKELRERVAKHHNKKGKLKLQAIQADVKALHLDKTNENALFQVASQFNLLEMVGANVSPEEGIEIYEHDHTQGPICAICCGAGTIYRNYFVPLDGQMGQDSKKQIDCLAKIGEMLGNKNNALWEMRNGYALSREDGLYAINRQLKKMDVDKIREQLQIGLMWDTQVTLDGSIHRVSQAYCSALPISYVGFPTSLWKPFASLILEASYEATICAGILNRDNKIYLTLVGGGVFGNELEWICSAIERACLKYADYDLDIKIVNYSSISGKVLKLIKNFGDREE